MKNKSKLFIIVAAVLVCAGSFGAYKVFAEQSGSTPGSNATSRIKTLYTDLTSLTYGSDTDSPDWGAYWNRIKTAAKWVPTGTAVEADVATGKTFYNTTRGAKTGTGTVTNLTPAGPCPTQQYYDAYGAPVTETTNCSLTWKANPGGTVTGDDAVAGRGGYDPRTGLTWSNYLKNNAGTIQFVASGGSSWNWNGQLRFTVTAANATVGATYTNNGQTFTVVTTIAGTTILTTTPTGSPAASGTLTKATGTGDATITFSSANATDLVNAAVGGKSASQLCTSQNNGWRLPTEKELLQAYIDGANFNLTQPSNNYWSLTESNSLNAYCVYLIDGYTINPNKTSGYNVRCVR